MNTRTILCGALTGMLAASGFAAEPLATVEIASSDSAAATPSASGQSDNQILNNPRLTQLLKAASLSPGVGRVARMAELEMDAAVIQTYVENSQTRYQLQPEDILYLRDHGISSSVITAMIERGADLRAQAAEESDLAPAAPSVQPVSASSVTYIASPAVYRPSGASTVTVIGSSYPHGLFRSARYHYPYPRVYSRSYASSYTVYGGHSRYSQSRHYGQSYRYRGSRGYRCYR